MNIKGKMLTRTVGTYETIPKGKKLVAIIGVAIVDEDFPDSAEYKLDGELKDKELALDIKQSSKLPVTKFDGWSSDNLLEEYPWGVAKPSSSRSKLFMKTADEALKLISNSYMAPIPKTKSEELIEILSKEKKTLPPIDSMKFVYENIIESLQKPIKSKNEK